MKVVIIGQIYGIKEGIMICKNGHYYSGDWCHICQEPLPKKKPKAMRKVAKKRVIQNKSYAEIRQNYLMMFPICQVKGCFQFATTIHHLAGRSGTLLTDVNNFLGCCMPCHQKIESEPIWAKEQGYSKSRI